MRAQRPLLTVLTGLALAAAGLVTTTVPAVAADTDIIINEVKMPGSGDWIELTNTGGADVTIGGWTVKDNNDARTLQIPAGTVVSPGRYYAVDTDLPTNSGNNSFGLGDADSARVFNGAGTLIASFSWTTPATTSYGRCPDRTGALTSTTSTTTVTKAAPNDCSAPAPAPNPGTPWPGGPDVKTIDPADTFTTQDASGLYYQPSGSSAPGTLWAVENNPSLLYKLTKTGATWGPAADFTSPKQIQYPGGTGVPDSEGLTMTDAGPAGGIFVATERDNAVGGTSRPAILRIDPGGTSPLVATRDWNLTADLPGLGANAGIEGITWVPDTALTGRGFRTSAGTLYQPESYPGHGTGLFFVGVEATGAIYAYALDQASNSFTRVASFASGLQKAAGGSAVMELSWEPATQRLWAVCDNDCTGQTSPFVIGDDGTFAAVATYGRPTNMPNLNNEGFAIAPHAECVAGAKPVFWADDGDTGEFSLREGTITCAGAPAPIPPPTVPTTPTTPTTPAPAADRVLPVVRITGVKAGKTYPKKRKARCVATDASGIRSCTLKTTKKKAKSVTRYVVTATAVDNAGNTATTTVTYKVGKKRKR